MGTRRKGSNRRQTHRFATRVTSKYQATVPKEIRDHLHIQKGDQIVYELLPDDTVTVRKVYPIDLEYLKAIESTLNEWNSEEDEHGYKNL